MTSSSKKMKRSAPETPSKEDTQIAPKARSTAKKGRRKSDASAKGEEGAPTPSKILKTPLKSTKGTTKPSKSQTPAKSPKVTPKPSKILKTPTKSIETPKPSKTQTPAKSPKGTPKPLKTKTPTKSPSVGKSAKKNKKVVEEQAEVDDPVEPEVEPATEEAETPKAPPSMDINVHRIRHLDYHPKPILCIRATPHAGPASNSCVAISRDNGSVELKSVSQKFRTIATIAGYREKQVNVMAWTCGGAHDSSMEDSDSSSPSTLVGASQDGTLFIVDFASGKFKGMIPSGGGGVFALTSLRQRNSSSGICGQLVAAGCEDGSVRVYRVDTQEGKLETISILPSAGSAVLSLAWARQDGGANSGDTEHGTVMYAGVADGTIRRYDCHSSKAGAEASPSWKSTLRMTVESYGRNIATRVWSLAALADGTVVSGDSLGHVQFWDGHSGTLQQTFDQNDNKADVLDLDVTSDGNKVFASGVDSRVVCIERPNVESSSSSGELRKWIMTTAQRPHTHDVRAVAICREPVKSTTVEGEDATDVQEILCTGGIDTKLCTYQVKDFQRTRPRTLYPWPSFTPISTAAEARLLMIRREDRIHLHRLGPQQSDSLTRPVVIPDDDTLVGTLEVQSTSNLRCTAISTNGRFVALSDASSLFLFALTFVQEKSGSTTMVPSRLPLKLPGNSPIAAMCFLRSDLLVLTEASGCIHIVALSAGGENPESDTDMDTDEAAKATLLQTIQPSGIVMKHGLTLPVHSISAIDDGTCFVTSRNGLRGDAGTIQVFKKDAGGVFRHWWDVPTLEVPHSALSFLKSSPPQLAVACMDFALYVFDVQERRLSSWSEDAGYPLSKSLPTELSNRTDYPVRLGMNPGAPSKLLMVRTLLIL
jgi:U3 small nucleolar RNA-associated protein 4